MGNNLSPPIAIIFMDFVETKIIQNSTVQFWRRYIDDIFYICSGNDAGLLEIANNIHPAIKFTQELPKDSKLPFLDLMLNRLENGEFAFKLYIKDIHSGHCMPYSSHVPYRQKKGLLTSEFLRARRCSSNTTNTEESLEMISSRFRSNGYPTRMIQEAKRLSLQRFQHKNNGQKNENVYLKLPFINQRTTNRIQQLVTNSGLPIRVTWSNPKPLSLLLRKSSSVNCPVDCVCNNRGLCFKKNVIYEVQCQICLKKYIGETFRTFHKRITEHMTTETIVHDHFKQEHPAATINGNITTRILASGCENTQHRLALEKVYIKKSVASLNVQHGN